MSKQTKQAKRTPPPPRPSSITPELGQQILEAVLTESPAPSQRELAKRYDVHPSSVQRFLKRNEAAVNQAKQSLATVRPDAQPTPEAVRAELVVGAIPGAVAEVRALTRDLPITKLCRVMQSAEAQYEKFKDSDPQLAGGYLDQMRKCAVEMAKWLGLDKGIGVQDNSLRITVNWRKGQ